MNKKRTAAFITAVLLLLSLIFSLIFIASESDHHCCGDNCSICNTLYILEKNINERSSSVISAIILLLTFSIIIEVIKIRSSYIRNDLIIQKIRLNI